MRVLVAVACVLAFAAASYQPQVVTDDLRQARFEEWRGLYKKVYHSFDEYAKRLDTFHKNLEFITKHNEKKLNYTMRANEYADMSFEEFRTRFGLGKVMQHKKAVSQSDLSDYINLPQSVDWTEKGAVTAVKNQGQCGSCYAFSTTGAVEGAWAVKHKSLISLSEQQLVDCSGPEGDYGCNGGLMDFGFQYMLNHGGLCTEDSYPYSAESDTCRADACRDVVQISAFHDVERNNEMALKAASVSQPISVAIEADQQAFQFYHDGVMDGECGSQLDHGVLLVGYGVEGNSKFWKIKNSWGGDWGERGYIRIARGDTKGESGQCGIACQPSYPIAA